MLVSPCRPRPTADRPQTVVGPAVCRRYTFDNHRTESLNVDGITKFLVVVERSDGLEDTEKSNTVLGLGEWLLS